MRRDKARRRKRRQSRISRSLRNDFGDAQQLYDDTFNFGDLPRIEDKYAKDNENLISLRQSFADPTQSTFAGNRSTDVSDILSRMQGGLEGYTAIENNALWERANRDINQELATELRGIEDSNAGNMVLGAAATARSDAARRNAQRQRMQNSQDLTIQNIDEKRSRLNEYASAVQGAESDEFQRGQTAIGNYENTLGNIALGDENRQAANIDLEMKDRQAYAAGLTGFADLIGNRRNRRKQNKLMERFYK